MDAKDDDAWTGNLISMQTRQIQDAFGASGVLNYRVLQTNEILGNGAVKYKYTLQSTDQDFQRIGVILKPSSAKVFLF